MPKKRMQRVPALSETTKRPDNADAEGGWTLSAVEIERLTYLLQCHVQPNQYRVSTNEE